MNSTLEKYAPMNFIHKEYKGILWYRAKESVPAPFHDMRLYSLDEVVSTCAQMKPSAKHSRRTRTTYEEVKNHVFVDEENVYRVNPSYFDTFELISETEIPGIYHDSRLPSGAFLERYHAYGVLDSRLAVDEILYQIVRNYLTDFDDRNPDLVLMYQLSDFMDLHSKVENACTALTRNELKVKDVPELEEMLIERDKQHQSVVAAFMKMRAAADLQALCQGEDEEKGKNEVISILYDVA